MIYYFWAPHFLFTFRWNHSPEEWYCVYFTTGYARSGLVAQTYIPRCQCPNEPRRNPIEFEFKYSDWLIRAPFSPWGIPFAWNCETPRFRFGNHGSYSVLVDFLGKGGRELWLIDAGGKIWCGKDLQYPKQGEYTYQGEREICNIGERSADYGGMGSPASLWLRTFSPALPQSFWISDDGKYRIGEGEAKPYTNFPTLTVLLPYKGETYIHLFDYPEPRFASHKLAELLSIETVEDNEGYLYGTPMLAFIPSVGMVSGRQVLGYHISRTILLNLYYRAWDIFLPFAISIPCPEGTWIITLSKCLKDKKRIEIKLQNEEKTTGEIIYIPIWEYKVRWYLANSRGISLQKETILPKSSETSFIWYLYPILKTSGELGVYVYEIDHLPENSNNKCDLYAGIYLASGRKLNYKPSDFQNVPDPNNFILFPLRDYPNYLNYEDPWSRISYFQNYPQTKHRRFTQCYSAIPPYPSFPLGRPSPAQDYNWHTETGNFLSISWERDEREEIYAWVSRDYLGTRIPLETVDATIPPPDVLNSKLGEPIKESVFLSFLQRPEIPETILFWFKPEDPNFSYILKSYLSHLQSVLYRYPDGAPQYAHLPYEFCLNPKDPTPISWGNLKMMVWRKGRGVVAKRDLGRYPIQYLFPAIEKQTGAIYLPLMADMQGDGSGIFKLLVFRRNDWSPEIYGLGDE